MALTAEGEARFRRPDSSPIPPDPDARFRGNALSLWARHKLARLSIGPKTLPPNWRGESMDYGMAVDSLLAREGPGAKPPAHET